MRARKLPLYIEGTLLTKESILDEATAATVRDFKDWLVGKDPRNVEYLWATPLQLHALPRRASGQHRHQRSTIARAALPGTTTFP